MRYVHLLFALLFLALQSQAQTKIRIETQAQMTAPAGQVALIAVTPEGKIAPIVLDASLKLTLANGVYTLSATAPTQPSWTERTVKLVRATDGSYTLNQTPAFGLKVFRNGILQDLVEDYTVQGVVIRGTAKAGWQVEDVVVAVYFI